MPEQTSLERFLRKIAQIRATGAAVPETSYYPAFEALLSDIGSALSPRVKAIIHVQNSGAGIPDGGLFLDRPTGAKPLPDPLRTAPERGVVEIKAPDRVLKKVIATKQIRNYLERYGAVLVTNFREWALVVLDDDSNKPKQLETYALAGSEEELWQIAGDPKACVEAHAGQFENFLRRVLQHPAPLFNPKDVAWFLAAYARSALDRLRSQKLPGLATVRGALEDSLGVKFEGEEGEHFFHSTLVQTLFYGTFSAWVLWARVQPKGAKTRFRWHEAVWWLNVPMVRVLFHQIATPDTLGPLQLTELMDWAEDVLSRIERERFFERFDNSQAVQYFYEPFLEAFDPELRKSLGVWYTPSEVVTYMVQRIDQVLRDEFDLAEGLASDEVFVLDPCTGTGSYLVEVLRRIAETKRQSSGDALVGADVKHAALHRVFGFEILPASFVIAHLQLGLLLAEMGAPLDSASGQRASVFLTNSLTGWNDEGVLPHLPFAELEEERDAAHAVKRNAPILVVLGNPPYNAFAGVSPQEEGDLVAPYKAGLNEQWGITKNYLDDLYVRFFRVAERRIVEGVGKGIVSFISNYSYLSDPTYVVMRKHFLSVFDYIWIDCLNGDSRETGKRTPDGEPDPSVFSTPQNPAGIRVGTAVGLFVRRSTSETNEDAVVGFRQFWGSSKRQALKSSAATPIKESGYTEADPSKGNRYSYRPSSTPEAYFTWPPIVDLCSKAPSLGLNENRGLTLISTDKNPLEKRMQEYFGTSDYDQLPSELSALKRDYASFKPKQVWKRLQAVGFNESKVYRYLFKPLDIRWAYVETETNLWNRPRPDLVAWAKSGTRFLLVRPTTPRSTDGAALLFSNCLGDMDCVDGHAYFIPFEVPPPELAEGGLFEQSDLLEPNLSKRAASYLSTLGVSSSDPEYADLLWFHALAVGYSKSFLESNADGIRSGWVRVPLPGSSKELRASRALGERLSKLLDPDVGVPGVTSSVAKPFDLFGSVRRVGGGNLPESELVVTAGWGHVQRGGSTMPGSGKVVHRPWSEEEQAALESDDHELLGDHVLDVYLNESGYFECIPLPVWEYRIGGHQVLKKWLSYRDEKVLGRRLTSDEARHFSGMVRRVAAIVLLGPSLDASYHLCRDAAYTWPEAD